MYLEGCIMDKLRLQFYRERKVKSLAGFKIDNTITIHQLINSKVDYDPFDIKNKGTSKHNMHQLLKSKYRQFKRGSLSREELLHWLGLKDYLSKYVKRFTL